MADPKDITAREKSCKRCGETKPLDQFSRDPTGRCGRQSQCKSCCVTKNQARRNLDPVKTHLQRQREYRRAAANGKGEADRAYYKANREHILARTATWRDRRREIIRAQNREYARNNPERFATINQRRRAALANPPWADRKVIDAFYLACPPGTSVDHIVPLKGITVEGYRVCGLHVPWNLQYLPVKENHKKKNRMRPQELPTAPTFEE